MYASPFYNFACKTYHRKDSDLHVSYEATVQQSSAILAMPALLHSMQLLLMHTICSLISKDRECSVEVSLSCLFKLLKKILLATIECNNYLGR